MESAQAANQSRRLSTHVTFMRLSPKLPKVLLCRFLLSDWYWPKNKDQKITWSYLMCFSTGESAQKPLPPLWLIKEAFIWGWSDASHCQIDATRCTKADVSPLAVYFCASVSAQRSCKVKCSFQMLLSGPISLASSFFFSCDDFFSSFFFFGCLVQNFEIWISLNIFRLVFCTHLPFPGATRIHTKVLTVLY